MRRFLLLLPFGAFLGGAALRTVPEPTCGWLLTCTSRCDHQERCINACLGEVDPRSEAYRRYLRARDCVEAVCSGVAALGADQPTCARMPPVDVASPLAAGVCVANYQACVGG